MVVTFNVFMRVACNAAYANDDTGVLYPVIGVIQLTANNTIDWFPAISGTSVVWEGQDGSDFEIFLAVPPFTNPVSLPSLSIWGYLALAGCLASSAVMRNASPCERTLPWTTY